MKEILIAGGGIIGLHSAYFLKKAGHNVTIVDEFDFLKNCSISNAGLIVPSHFIPLASPGIIRQAFVWMLNNKSPLSFNLKPDTQLIKWIFKFWKASNQNNKEKAGPLLLEMNSISKNIYKQISADTNLKTQLREDGLLMLCQSPKTFSHEIKIAKEARKLGINTVVLDRREISNFETETKFDVAGGVFYPDDAIISPEPYILSLIDYLKSENVQMIPKSKLVKFTTKGDKIISAETKNEKFFFDELVVSSGYASQKILNTLKVKTLLQPGKGYSFKFPFKLPLKSPLILVDARVSVSPYTNFTRFGGVMDLGGDTDKVVGKRIQGMVESIKRFIPEINLKQPANDDIWIGMRPCSTDGLPYIGRVNKYKNMIIATGHSMMGTSLAPITGKLVEEIVSGKKTTVKIDALSPER